MTKRTLLIAAAVLTLAAGTAQASSVAYIDDNNLWLSSPDGSQKVQLSQAGDTDHPFGQPSQGPDGKTIAYHSDAFEVDGSSSAGALSTGAVVSRGGITRRSPFKVRSTFGKSEAW